MLNKDQYDQEEYNNYYRQETQGAEIKGSNKEEGKGKNIILFSTLLLLGVAGYFGFTKFNTSSEISTIKDDTPKTEKAQEEIPKIQKEVIEVKKEQAISKVEENVAKIPETNIATTIESSIASSEKMSPEEIAKVVQMVMVQMNQTDTTKTTEEKNSDNSQEKVQENTNDSELMSALSDSMVDTITESKNMDYTSVTTNKNIEVKESKKTVNTYNKVTIQTTSGTDELSKLSEQISNVIQETEDSSPSNGSTSTNYTKSITKEVATRSNAMRVIIVKKGDTLGKIARRAYGNVMDYKKIYDANPDLINRADRIYIGQKLRIPE